jgi:hypothetical protein
VGILQEQNCWISDGSWQHCYIHGKEMVKGAVQVIAMYISEVWSKYILVPHGKN